jgi:YD repeat-containing protein
VKKTSAMKLRRVTLRLFAVWGWSSLALFACSGSITAQTVTYIYDALGRVVGVVSPSGDAAVYAYDPTGNITSISTYHSTQLSIMTVTPDRGAVHCTVTVYGTGFSATASQDTVKFNGTAAKIVSATANSITTEVPTGATTGPITVTTPAGKVVSKNPFVVTPNEAPTISAFEPAIVAPGEALAISGTSFQSELSTDSVRLNGTATPAKSATATEIHTSVAAASTSGHISVSTPYGQAISSGDLYVVPTPHTTSQVAFTGRMKVNTTKSLSIKKSNDIGLMIFDETSGHRVTLALPTSTFEGCELNLVILSPSNVTVASDATTGCLPPNIITTPVLTETGTYTVLAYTGDGSTGTASLSLFDIAQDFSAPIEANGETVTANFTAPGEDARLTFTGKIGENISLNLTPTGTFDDCSVNLAILKPDGSTLNSTQCVGTAQLISQVVLPMNGTYTILLTTTDNTTGTLAVNLYSVVNVTGTITIGGPPVKITLGTPGQIANLTFSGAKGQKLIVSGDDSTVGCTLDNIVQGAKVVFNDEECGASWSSSAETLPSTGKYTLSIVPQDAPYTGSLRVQITAP